MRVVDKEHRNAYKSSKRSYGAWRRLVAHLVWDQGVEGSNPFAPTI